MVTHGPSDCEFFENLRSVRLNFHIHNACGGNHILQSLHTIVFVHESTPMVRVLLLEDNANMLNMLAQVLEWGGYEVLMARDGLEGIQVLEKANPLPRIIISDLSMPDMDGYEFLQHVRNKPQWANIPYIIMSAHSSPEDRHRALENGADEFLVKPFNLDDFQQVLHRWETSG